MTGIFTRAFWRDAAERTITTAAEAALLAVGAGQVNALEVSWETVGGFALGGGVLALLKSIVASQVGDPTTAGFTTADDTPPQG